MNKDSQTTESVEKLKAVKLSDSSRARIENNLLEYARFHGVRVGEESRSIGQVSPLTTWRTSLFTVLRKPKSMTAAIIAIALIAGGGTSYAAESAVPGDALYVVKTEVNENVKSAFAVSNEAEAELQARLAAERLEEAETLAARGELTSEASTDISVRLKAHYEDAERRSETAAAEGDYETSATVRASLEGNFRTYADVLTDLNTRVSGNNGTTLIADIRTYADTTAQAQATTAVDVSADAEVDVKAIVERADTLVADAEAKVARAESKLSAEAKARVEAKLTAAVSAHAEAQASLRTEAYQAAYTSAQTAIRIANEASAMVDSMLRLQVDVGVNTETGVDGVIDVRTNENPEGETRTNSNTGSSTDTNNERDNSVDVEVEANSDTNANTGSTSADAETDTSVRSGLRL